MEIRAWNNSFIGYFEDAFIKSLYNIDDSFKKIIFTKSGLKPAYDENGVLIIDLFDFLLFGESWE